MNIKRIVSVFTAVVLLFTNASTVFAAENPTVPDLESIYEEYKDDEQFKLMRSEYGEEYAETFLKDVLKSRIESGIAPAGGGGNECYQSVTNIKQTKNYNCGTTTVLQTLYGLNSQGNVTGSTNADKIATLDNEYNVDGQGHLIVFQAAAALNKYYHGRANYIYVQGKNLKESTFEDYVAKSLTNCKPVILHARTQYIGYYGGHASRHYLSLDYINRTTDIVRIVDCNNNDVYYGIHYVPLSEAFNSINKESDRYLIY